MRRVVLPAIILLLLAGIGGGAWWYLSTQPGAVNQLLAELELEPVQVPGGISASGFIEAEKVSLSTEVGGRIEAILADEGDEVERGQVLIELDTAMLRAQIRQAEARVKVAQAQLARVEAGARAEDIYTAEAALAQAEAAAEGARQAWLDAQTARDNPQELEAQIDAAKTQLAVAEHQVKQAIANKDAAEKEHALLSWAAERLEKGFDVYFQGVLQEHIDAPSEAIDEAYYQGNLAGQKLWAAWEALAVAEAARDGAKANLDNLLARQAEPLTLNAQVDAARARYETAQAAVAVAEANLEAVRAGATEEQIALAQAQVTQAEAALNALQVQLKKMTLPAPSSGLVVERMVNVGEMAAPGAALTTLADLDEVTLTIYIAEDEIGRVKVGQVVEVSVDSFPGEKFIGKVTYVANQAEFTPKSVQTKKERVNLVFGVKVKIPNPEHKLKPGMPADAVIK